MSSYRKTMAEALSQVREAQMVSDISGISIPALKRETAKFNIKVARVTPGGPMGAEYEVTFTGAEKDLIAYAKEHFGFDDKPGNFMQLKKHLNMSYNDIEEISDKLKLKVLARNIKKLKDKFLKKTIPGTGAMFAQKEEVELDEGRMKDIFTADQEGKSAEEIAKLMKLPLKTVKSILGESDAYDNERYEIRNGKAYRDVGNTPDKKNHVYAPDKKTAEKIFKQGKKVFREATIKPYVSMQRSQATGKMNYVVLDKDEKEAFRSTNQTVATDYWKKNYDKLKEETIVEFSDAMLDKLKREYEPLKGKTISVDQANKLRKIFNMIPDRALDALRKKKIPFLSGLALSRMVQKGMPVKEEAELKEFKKMTVTFTDAQRMAKAHTALTRKGFDVELSKDKGFVLSVDGKGADLNKFATDIKNFMGGKVKAEGVEEELELDEITIKKVDGEKGFDYKGQFITDPTTDPSGRFDVDPKKYYKLTDKQLKDLKESDINVDNVKKDDNEKEKELKIKLDKEKDQDALEKQLIAAQGQINILKQKLENEKNKAIKPEPNPDTGEVPLTVGVAYKHFKDKKEKEEVKKEDVSEKAMTDKEKRIQRAKDMIKYYDAQKKAALKGKNKDLAKKMLKNDINEARFEVEGRVDYKGVRGGDDFSIVVDAPNEKAAEKKVEDMLFKHRDQRKIGPRGGRGVDDYEIESVERTSKSVTNKFSTYHAAEKDPSIKEADLSKKQIKMVHKVADDLPKKDFKDRYGKEKGDAVRFGTATNMIKKKLGMKEDRRLYVETIAGLKKKAEKSGMPYSILKKVYDRGMAAWKSGHRPGASQQQWAFARVNSFVTKSSGTWGGADKDLAKQVRGK